MNIVTKTTSKSALDDNKRRSSSAKDRISVLAELLTLC